MRVLAYSGAECVFGTKPKYGAVYLRKFISSKKLCWPTVVSKRWRNVIGRTGADDVACRLFGKLIWARTTSYSTRRWTRNRETSSSWASQLIGKFLDRRIIIQKEKRHVTQVPIWHLKRVNHIMFVDDEIIVSRAVCQITCLLSNGLFRKHDRYFWTIFPNTNVLDAPKVLVFTDRNH
jgi:hypothetical protein